MAPPNRKLKAGPANSDTPSISNFDGSDDSGFMRALSTRFSLYEPPGVAVVLAFYTAYLAAAAFGLWLAVIPGISVTIWPPNGIVLAALLTNPKRSWLVWIAVGALGELTGNLLWFHNPILPALGYVVANTLQVVLSASVLTWLVKGPVDRLNTLKQVFAFLAVCVLAAPVIGATIGSTIDAAVGKSPFEVTWPLWWLGDGTGILIATPLVISGVNALREKAWPTAAQAGEALAIGALLSILSAWQLSGGPPYLFLLLIPILWSALRFEFRGTGLTVLLLATMIGLYAHGDSSALATSKQPVSEHTRLQVFLVFAASMGLIVAAIIRQLRKAARDLASINTCLEQRVSERTRAIEAAERRFKATFENAAVGIAIVNADGTLLNANDGLGKMLGYDAVGLQGETLDHLTHHEDLALGNAAWEKLRSGTSDTYELDKRYVRKDGQTVWGHTSVSCVRKPNGDIDYLIKIIQDVTPRKNSDEARQLLMHEVNHRSKNLLTIVQAIARQTAATSRKEFIAKFGQRLRALSANQDMLVKSGWERVSLKELLHSQLDHFGELDQRRIVINGPELQLTPSAAQALGMTVHELATNAAKYGALSNDSGRVGVAWAIDGSDFTMSWQESGGPPVVCPKKFGFGATVIDGMTAATLSGDVAVDYAPAGLTWRLKCPLSALREAKDTAEKPGVTTCFGW